jgi:hypothetical protein
MHEVLDIAVCLFNGFTSGHVFRSFVRVVNDAGDDFKQPWITGCLYSANTKLFDQDHRVKDRIIRQHSCSMPPLKELTREFSTPAPPEQLMA